MAGAPSPRTIKFDELIGILPTAAVVFDKNGRLLSYNALYREQFFATKPRVLKRGTPREVIFRSWAYDQGLSEAEIEELVRARFTLPPISRSGSGVCASPMPSMRNAAWSC